MNASVTAREMARANLTDAIKEAARHQVAVEGAARLSVRAVAREVGMVSSAVYRYFPTRDDLLTALIIDAYNAVGEAVETADRLARDSAAPDSVPAGIRPRWRAVCAALRDWARTHPHEYGLIYGSPIPDYRAPQDTIGPAARLPIAMLRLVDHAWSIGAAAEVSLRAPSPTGTDVDPVLAGQADQLTHDLSLGLPRTLVIRSAMVWAQLTGIVTFELFGQFVGSFDPTDALFAASVELTADLLGMS